MISWGEDSRNGFGLVKPNGLDTTKTDISCVNLIDLKSQIQGLSAGNSVVAFIRNNGRLVSVARIQEDQDGRRITGKLKSVTCKETIRALSCGDSHAVLLSEEGRVLCLDKANILRPLDNLCNRQVTQVACGDQHSISLTQDGQVFTWGQNTSGQLGLGWGEPSAMSPKPLKSLSGIPLVQITAGGDHSFALSLSGAVFGWGKNTAGQLGLGDTTNRHAPAPVDCLNLKKTVLISCGGEHTAVLTKGGVVFTFGSGHYGQLGHNSLRDELQPRVVGQLWGSKVTQIACGRHHTLAFVGPSNKIYSFGHGEQGQLGNGVKIDQSVPLPVQLPDQIDDQKIEHIFAGGNHSFALCTLGQEPEERSNNLRSSVGKVTQQAIDEEIIDKWISECDSKSWKKVQNCDKHFQTSPKQSGLDLSHRKLAKKDKVLTEVEAVVQHTLLPSLYEEPIGVESLRVYLVLPELLRVLHKQHRRTDLTEAVAAAILRLHPDKLQVLGDCWSSLKPSVMTKHIGVWKKALSGILRSEHILRTRDPGINHLLQVLGHLHRANQKSVETQTVPDSTFCMEEVHFNPKFLEEDVKLWRLWSKQDVDQTPAIFCRYPFLMNLQSKINVFNINAALTQVMWGDVAVELDPKETGKLVTSANKKEFVDTYVNYIFNQSVEVVFEEFRKGFFKVCDMDVVEFFQPEELRGVMVGKEIFDWETLKQNTVYEGEYHAGHPNIVTFWEVFEELTEDQKKAFLLFLTGCDRVPILGMNQIRMRVQTLLNSSQQHFPEALTCHSLLQLPIYPSKEILQSRLIEAVGHNRGFWNE